MCEIPYAGVINPVTASPPKISLSMEINELVWSCLTLKGRGAVCEPIRQVSRGQERDRDREAEEEGKKRGEQTDKGGKREDVMSVSEMGEMQRARDPDTDRH